jgi:hypothetical protein
MMMMMSSHAMAWLKPYKLSDGHAVQCYQQAAERFHTQVALARLVLQADALALVWYNHSFQTVVQLSDNMVGYTPHKGA